MHERTHAAEPEDGSRARTGAVVPTESMVTPIGALAAITTAAAVRTLVHSGVLDVLEAAGPLSTADLAARSHVRSEPLGLLLAPLEEGGVVERDSSGRWMPVGTAAAWRLLMLADESPFDHFLEGVVAHDGADGRTSVLDRGYAEIAEVLGRIGGSMARQTSDRYVAPGGRLLELGAGDAPWARAMLASEPTMTAVVVDRPAVADRLVDRLGSLEFSGRIEVVAGDVFEVDINGRFDVIVVSSLCRLLSDEENELLFGRLAEWAEPGGCVLVFDAVRDGTVRPGLAAYELSLARRTRRGRVYALGDFERWALAAGFGRPRLGPVEVGCHVLLEFRSGTDAVDRSDTTNNDR